MKLISLIGLLLASYLSSALVYDKLCFPDKGIRKAASIAYLESAPNEHVRRQETTYNKRGQPVLIHRMWEGTEHRREYADGRLQRIITTRKALPDVFTADQRDSLLEHAKTIVDTAVVSRHHTDGRAAEMRDASGTVWKFHYFGCDVEIILTLSAEGDTIQQVKNLLKDGVLQAHVWTPYFPEKSTVRRRYFDYQFDDRGHWTKRRSRVGEEVTMERRELVYY